MDDPTADSVLREAGNLPSDIPVEEVFPTSLPRQWQDFQRSGTPCRVSLVADSKEPQIPGPPASLGSLGSMVREAFAAGNPLVQYVPSTGRRVIVDFLRKICMEVDQDGAVARAYPVCWVDVKGEVFTSARVLGVGEAFVRRAFHRSSQGRLAINAVSRCRHFCAALSGFSDKRKRHAVTPFGWYGASAADVEEAANGGEVPENWQLIGPEMAHGRGVHVSAANCLGASARLSLRSANGQPAKVLLCAVAPGSREVVPPGSSQTQPTNSFFHTGTDSLASTKWYVFWKGRITTSFLPLYQVTFSATA